MFSRTKSAIRYARAWAARFVAPEGLLICYKSLGGPSYENVAQLRAYADAMSSMLPPAMRDSIGQDREESQPTSSAQS